MTKKIPIPLLIALLCALFVSGVALAAEDAPQGRVQTVYGEIIAITDDSFTLQSQSGDLFTYFVDKTTNYRSSDVEEPNFSDLFVGGKISVFAPGNAEEYPTARLVIMLPEDFDPSEWAGARARGQVIEVNPDAGSFVVQTNSGEEQAFSVDDTTRFFGQLASLSDVQVGWSVGVGAVENDDGGLLAKLIIGLNVQDSSLHAGTITVVIPAAGTFTMQTRQGEEMTIAVDENTNFNSRAREIQGLVDLAPDMVAVVYGSSQDDYVFMASRVIVGDAEDLPNYDVKALGQITGIGIDSVSLQSRNGEELTFLVDEETNFRSREGEVSGLVDLIEGMSLLIGAYEDEDGQIVAKLIFVRESQTP